ncbi:uncharacterized protein LOC143275467 [Babylonia areolata]|uniref:uncharacterized protein LOC143275467 n=1 Tax=Babylonia areolata TaxID=304850 RepID=UPI003FD36E6F
MPHPDLDKEGQDVGVGVPQLELVLSFNVAGAYGPMHPTPKAYLKHLLRSLDDEELVHSLLSTHPKRTRIAVFAHGLHPSMEGLQQLDFTDDVSAIRHFAAMTSALKWGAREHCYELVLRKARSLSWIPGSKRALVLVGCTRPHDGHHAGSVERIHWRVEARCLAQMGIPVFAVQIKLQREDSEFYRQLAEMTEGCHVTLEQCTPMADVLRAIACHLEGSQPLEDLEQQMSEDADSFTHDMARLFVTLHHHRLRQPSPPSTPTGTGTPAGSDFGDDMDDDEGHFQQQEATSSEPEVSEHDQSSSSIPESSASAAGACVQPLALKRCTTAPAPLRASRTLKSAHRSWQADINNGAVESSRKRPNLRRGVTTGAGGGGRGLGAVDGGWQGSRSAAGVYKIDREAPIQREIISPRTFTLRHLSWSPWQLVISPALPPPPAEGQRQEDWEPRCDADPSRGYRRRGQSLGDHHHPDDDPPTTSAALYELAVQPAGTSRKLVVLHRLLTQPPPPPPGQGQGQPSTWEDLLLGRGDDVRKEVDEAVGEKKCSVFVRRAPLAQGGARARRVVEAALHRYDYAWNDLQGLRRTVRRVSFLTAGLRGGGGVSFF